MEQEPAAKAEQAETVGFEPPRIHDYGTLAELTAGKHGSKSDWFGSQRGGGGGYS
jgi:hypothetical protein